MTAKIEELASIVARTRGHSAFDRPQDRGYVSTGGRERRLKAAVQAKIDKVPVVVRRDG
jgi:ParB-like chromosome segregation protein Spo0J